MTDITEMTDEEFKAFEAAIDKGDWMCEHNRPYSADCTECDEEWMLADNGETALEEDPSHCDHNIELMAPKYGACAECDAAASNTKKLSPSLCYRIVSGQRYKYDNRENLWVPVAKASAATYLTGTTYTYTPKHKCKHFMDEVKLDAEHSIFASAERDAPYNDKRDKEDYPDIGVYLYSGWVSDYHSKFTSSPGLNVPWENSQKAQPEWAMAYVDWPDYSVPTDFSTTLKVIDWTWERIEAGKVIETGCLGGHGRTGTFLACLLVAKGMTPLKAMDKVWTEYCEDAIESKSQIQLVVSVYEAKFGKQWRQSKIERDGIEGLLNPPKKASDPKGSGTTVSQRDVTCIHGRQLSEACYACGMGGTWY